MNICVKIPRLLACLLLAHLANTETTRADIQITRILPPNLVNNPSMEDGSGREAQGWAFDSGQASNFQIGRVNEGFDGSNSLWARSLSGRMSGYWSQAVNVEPGRTYVFRGKYRLGGGRMLIWVNGSAMNKNNTAVRVDKRYHVSSPYGHWLSPVFLPVEALVGPDPKEWTPFELKVEVPNPVRAVRLSMGMYFAPGEAWFDDVWVGLDEADLKVEVKPTTGRINRVIVSDAKDKRQLYDSGHIVSKAFSQTVLKARPLDETYLVETHLSNGKRVHARYPQVEELKER